MGCLKLTYYAETEPKINTLSEELTLKISSETLRSSYLFGFNGKEKDDEVKGDGNSLDFGARIYDSRLGRFLSLDPLMKDYPMMTPYCFAANNPVRLIDVDGKGPGDPFDTEEEAAIDFAMNYNDNSISENREFGSVIYSYKNENGSIQYSYTVPIRGTKESSPIPTLTVTSKGEIYVADIHSHGAYTELSNFTDEGGPDYNNNFSDDPNSRRPGDIQVSNKLKKKMYVATTNGSLLMYDPNAIKPEIKTIETGGAIPSDKNDPSQIPGINCDSQDDCKEDSDKWHKDEPYYKNKRNEKKDKESRNKDAKSHNVPSYESD